MVNVYSLSPSDESFILAQREIAKLIPSVNDSLVRVPIQSSNNFAVVLWIDINGSSILLGSDLEVTVGRTTGWYAILDSNTRPNGKANIYKIPHHGSRTADHQDIWSKLLTSNPIAMLTPFNRGKGLPTKEDVDRICKYTNRAHITSSPDTKSKINRSKVVEKQIKEVVRFIRPVQYSTGQVRFRSKDLKSNQYSIECLGTAKLLN
jgi:hypothetical protein